MEGDLVSWIPADIEDVEIGDVVVFKSWLSWPEEKLIVHRVTDIKQVWGKPALVTKGDANSWTDQKGPHIPEPYITEKNFIGKTISVGQTPLKVPFVGYIGIIVNEGLNLISQSSSAKGTFTSIGVFTPLTISVIILVVSIFILPEKAKTIKEKLRYLIFQSNPVNIKKLFLFFFTVFVVLLSTIHLFAYDSIDASYAVGEFPESSSFDLGSVNPGVKNIPRNLPVINPGILPVKGIVFGKGQLHSSVEKKIFNVSSGEIENVGISIKAPNGTKNGTYSGDVILYSSPLWFMFPDEYMNFLLQSNAEFTVLILDVSCGIILTIITLVTILLTAYFSEKYRNLKIDISWHFAPRLILKKGIYNRLSGIKENSKKLFGDKIWWISKIDFSKVDIKQLIIASLIIIPLILLFNSEILAMLIASVIAGIISYYLSCRKREKIILIAIYTMFIAIGYALVLINYSLFNSDRAFIESVALACGASGMYFLILCFFLIPLSILSWYVAHQIRNVKEHKDPLLVLEGRCDL